MIRTTAMHPGRAVFVVALTLLPWAATTGKANEYSMGYRVEGGYEYNDNLGMDPEDQDAASSLELNLPLTLTARGDRMGANLLAEASASKYNDDGYDHNNQSISGDVNYLLERGTVAANAGYQRASTLDTEFLDTGVIAGNSSRVDISSVGGSAGYTLTEKNSVTAVVNYLERLYDNPRYQDFKVINGYAGWLYNWTEQTTLEARGTAGRFENEGNARLTSSSEALGFMAGFNSRFSEQLHVSLLGGLSQVDSQYSLNGVTVDQADDNNIGYSLNGTLQYEQERYQVSADLARRLNPSGNGYITEFNELGIRYGYSMSERMSLGLSLTAGYSTALDSRINNDRNFGATNAQLSYKLSQYWSVAGRYTWRYQDNETEDGSAQSNSVSLSVIYHPERTMWSR